MSGFATWSRCIVLGLALGGCGGAQDPRPATPLPADAQGDAVLQAGDVQLRASVVQASSLPPSIARRYGAAAEPGTLLLLVVGNRGPEASAVPVPIDVVAKATDLRGGEQRIAMRQYRDGDALDSIGTLRTTLPETLRFELQVAVEGKPPVAMAFVREFYPQ